MVSGRLCHLVTERNDSMELVREGGGLERPRGWDPERLPTTARRKVPRLDEHLKTSCWASFGTYTCETSP
jgi:hypothetical protein